MNVSILELDFGPFANLRESGREWQMDRVLRWRLGEELIRRLGLDDRVCGENFGEAFS
jgi:hypothetical protein